MWKFSFAIKLFDWFLLETFKLWIMDYIPKRKEWDAWFDVRSTIDCDLHPWEVKKIPLWFWIELPDNMYARVEWRSWNAFKFGIDTIWNIIDPSYRWEVHAILVNNWNEIFSIVKWDRIAQIIVSEFIHWSFVVVDNLSETKRWDKGFGSSWLK